MTRITATNDLARLESLMELVDQPMFLVSVRDDGGFRFRRINAAHSRQTGIDASALADQSPEDVLPPRLAETVCANYARCVAAESAVSYEELLQLNTGPRWWMTTLTPFRDLSGRVVALLGTAIDITEKKHAEMDALDRAAQVQRMNDSLQVFASIAAHDVKAPLAAMVSMLDHLADGFVDIGDGKRAELEVCQSLARRAMDTVDRVGAHAGALIAAPQAASEVQVAQICRDAVALNDPDGRISVDLPESTVLGEPAVLQKILHRFVASALSHASGRIHVDCADHADGLAIVVADDGALASPGIRHTGRPVVPDGDGSATEESLVAAVALIEARGGSISQAVASEDLTAALCIILPGMRLQTDQAGPPRLPVRAATHVNIAAPV